MIVNLSGSRSEWFDCHSTRARGSVFANFVYSSLAYFHSVEAFCVKLCNSISDPLLFNKKEITCFKLFFQFKLCSFHFILWWWYRKGKDSPGEVWQQALFSRWWSWRTKIYKWRSRSGKTFRSPYTLSSSLIVEGVVWLQKLRWLWSVRIHMRFPSKFTVERFYEGYITAW